MKGKSKYLVLLILLLVICGGLTTYALFRTNKSGNANVNAARWNVVFKNGEEEISNNFNISLNNATWTNPLGNVASGKIAPGSSATFYITIDATNTETDVYYESVIGDSFNDPNFEVTVGEDSGVIAYSTTSGAMVKQIPITVVWNGNINDNESKNSDDLLKKAQSITIPVTITAAQKLALRYTVTFNDGFGNVISTKKVSEGDTVGTLPSNPTKVGYTFNGWYDAVENGNEVTISTQVSSGMQIYAHWNIKYITVTFNSNGGSSVSSQQVQEGGTLSNIPTSTKSQSELIGWFDSNDNQLTTSTIIMNDISYTARWYNAYTRAGTLLYYDPKTTNTCDSTTFNLTNVKNGTSTCYKWRIIKEDENNVTIQMDHNLVNKSNWYSSDDNRQGPYTVLSALANATSSWSRLPGLTYEYDTSASKYNYGTLSCIDGTCTMPGGTINNVKARLITGEEVAAITQTQTDGTTYADSYSLSKDFISFYFSNTGIKIGTNKNGTGNTNLSWLIENTYAENSSGAFDNIYGEKNVGYWTLTPSNKYTTSSTAVNKAGNLGTYTLTSNRVYYYGARPVITIPKSEIN